MLDAIKPSNAGSGGDILEYSNLEESVKRYEPLLSDRWDLFLSSDSESLAETENAKQLAMIYFIMSAAKGIDSPDEHQETWADRFTQASCELYGAPDKQEALGLLRAEYALLESLVGNKNVSNENVMLLMRTYQGILENSVESSEASGIDIAKENVAINQYGRAIRERYQPLFDLVDSSESADFSPQQLEHVFTSAITWLAEHDDRTWAEWSVEMTDGTMLSVDAAAKKIKIASKREAASADDARALLAHELLVHALRGKNGHKASNKNLATGLANYLDAEEGLGILVEQAISGELPEKAYDRYVDIALALGVIDGKQKNRHEMFKISYARHLIRAQQKGKPIDETSLSKKVWTHIDLSLIHI